MVLKLVFQREYGVLFVVFNLIELIIMAIGNLLEEMTQCQRVMLAADRLSIDGLFQIVELVD